MKRNRKEIRQLEKLMESVASLRDHTTEDFPAGDNYYGGVLSELQARYQKLTGNHYHTQTIERRAKNDRP